MAPLVQEAVTFTSGVGYAAPQTYGQETVTYSAPPVVQETVLSAAPPVQEAVTFTSGVGYAAPQAYGQETVTYGATPAVQETVTYAAPPVQEAVTFTSGVGYAPNVGGQGVVTYGAPSVQGTVAYSAGGGSVAPQTLAYGQETVTYGAPSVGYTEQQLTDVNLLFDQLDANKNGVISRDEFTALVAGAMYKPRS